MRLRRTLPALPLSTAAHAAVPLPAYLRCAISSNCDSAACPLAAHEAPLHPYRLHATCYCYSAACYYRPAKFRCTPYLAARDAAVLPPAITGPRFPLHAYSCMRRPQPTQPSMLQPSHQRMCGPEGEYNVAITPKFWGAEAHSPRRFVS